MKTQAHKPTSPQAPRFLVFLMVAFSSIFLNAQNTQDYYVEIKEGISFEIQNKQTNPDSTLTITTNIPALSAIINSKSPYGFKKAFPTAVTPKLQRVYIINVQENTNLTDLSNRSEIQNIEPVEEYVLAGHYPNDYIEVILENLPNTAMDLIKAPLAWTITQGDPNILIGIVDGGTYIDHEDLQSKIVMDIDYGPADLWHGTAVASLAAANTNNGIGMAAIGYNCRLVTADVPNWNRVLEVSQIPGVKVINCSFVGGYNQYAETVYQEIHDSGILVVASAGNENGQTYYYPASYDSTLSVTAVGNRYPIGYHHTNTQELWAWSWKDCHDLRPDEFPGYSSVTHNDKVDVCAPGQGIVSAWYDPTADPPAGYKMLTNNTSSVAPIVSGLAGLIYSINPNFTAQQVKDIIRDTADDIYHIPYNQQYLGQLGTGRINAFRAVKTADCMVNPVPGLDLAMQNSYLDDFSEPDTETEIVWNSEDIWVRNEDDGTLIDVHRNPEYDPNNPNYV